jgi:phage FluMu protein Com
MPQTNGEARVREWRCSHCEMLLGTERDGKLYIKVKKSQLVIQGSITAVCGYCAELNEFRTAATRRAR